MDHSVPTTAQNVANYKVGRGGHFDRGGRGGRIGRRAKPPRKDEPDGRAVAHADVLGLSASLGRRTLAANHPAGPVRVHRGCWTTDDHNFSRPVAEHRDFVCLGGPKKVDQKKILSYGARRACRRANAKHDKTQQPTVPRSAATKKQTGDRPTPAVHPRRQGKFVVVLGGARTARAARAARAARTEGATRTARAARAARAHDMLARQRIGRRLV